VWCVWCVVCGVWWVCGVWCVVCVWCRSTAVDGSRHPPAAYRTLLNCFAPKASRQAPNTQPASLPADQPAGRSTSAASAGAAPCAPSPRPTCVPEHAAHQHVVHRPARLVHRLRDDDALARRQAARLDHDGRALRPDVGLGHVGAGEGLIGGSGDVVFLAHVLWGVRGG
jgi:hypothetical protein